MDSVAGDVNPMAMVGQILPKPGVPDGKSVSGVMVSVPIETVEFAIGVLTVIANEWHSTAEYYRRAPQSEIRDAKASGAQEYFETISRHVSLLYAAKGIHEAAGRIRSPFCTTDIGDGSTIYDTRPRR